MIVSVVACGSSASEWFKTTCDYSIGCNDAFKWGHKFNALALFNHRTKFTRERQDTILKTRPVKLFTNCLSWVDFFPDYQLVKLRSYDGILYKNCDRHVSADTSPIIAMSLAVCKGAKKIILWGCDYKNHHIYSEQNPHTKEEIRKYKGFTELLAVVGVETFIGAEGSALGEFLPIYKAN
jgi:hypothetical protein